MATTNMNIRTDTEVRPLQNNFQRTGIKSYNRRQYVSPPGDPHRRDTL